MTNPEPHILNSELRERLPDDIFDQSLLRLPLKALLMAGILLATGLVIYSIDYWWIKLFIGLVMGIFVFGLAIIGHDAGHRTASRNKLLNDLVGSFTMSMVGIPARGWRIKHDLHHKYVGNPSKDSDTEIWLSKYVTFSPRMRWFLGYAGKFQMMMWSMSLLRLYGREWIWAFHILRNRKKFPTMWWWNISDIVLGTIFFSACVYFAYASFYDFFFCLLVPLLVGGWWAAAYIIPQHRGMALLDHEKSKSAVRWSFITSRTVLFPKWLQILHWIANYSTYQVEHHILVSVASYRLTEFSEILKKFAADKNIQLEHTMWHKVIPEIGTKMYIWGDKDHRLYSLEEANQVADSMLAEKQQSVAV